MFKKLSHLFLSALILLSLVSCASTKVEEQSGKPVLTKAENALFWTINGQDKEGKPSTLYVLGTFHAGDDRIYPLADNIEKAFKSSDRYYSEIKSTDYTNMMTYTLARMAQSHDREIALIEKTGKTYLDSFTPEQIAFLVYLLQSEEVLNQQAQFEPWVLLNFVSSVPIFISGVLDPTKGLDGILINRLNEEKKESLGLDTLDSQFAILEFGSRKEQIEAIKGTLDDLIKNSQEIITNMISLYEAYLKGNEEEFLKAIENEEKEKPTSYEKKLTKAVYNDRNEKWAKTFETLLNEGGETFIFAGSAHFVGDDNVFSYMRKNGSLQ